MKSAWLIPLIFISFGGCKKGGFDCFTTNGPVSTVKTSPGSFKYLVVWNNMDVYLRQGNEHSVEIETGSHLQKKISVNIISDTLILENTATCHFVRGYKKRTRITVTCPEIRRVTNNGVGPVFFSTYFNQDTLNVRAENSGDIHIKGNFKEVLTSSHGNGDIYLEGSSSSLQVYTFGTNYTRAENFAIKNYLFVSNISAGDVIFNGHGLGRMDYYIWRTGNIRYTGLPTEINNLGSDENAAGRLISED